MPSGSSRKNWTLLFPKLGRIPQGHSKAMSELDRQRQRETQGSHRLG
jgi:hypothetical protein